MNQRLTGVACVVFSALCYSGASTIVRLASDAGFPFETITLMTGGVRAICSAAIVACRPSWRSNARCSGFSLQLTRLVALRYALRISAALCAFGAYARVPVHESTTLISATPIWAIFFARAFLDETLAASDLCASALICIGAALITGSELRPGHAALAPLSGSQPGPGPQSVGRVEHAFGVLLALSAACLEGSSLTAARAISCKVPVLVQTMYVGLGLALLGALMALINGAYQAPGVDSLGCAPLSSWLLVLAGGVVGGLAHALLLFALRQLPTGPVAMLSTLDVVFAFAWHLVRLREAVARSAIVGVLLIVGCSATVGLQQVAPGRRASWVTRRGWEGAWAAICDEPAAEDEGGLGPGAGDAEGRQRPLLASVPNPPSSARYSAGAASRHLEEPTQRDVEGRQVTVAAPPEQDETSSEDDEVASYAAFEYARAASAA